MAQSPQLKALLEQTAAVPGAYAPFGYSVKPFSKLFTLPSSVTLAAGEVWELLPVMKGAAFFGLKIQGITQGAAGKVGFYKSEAFGAATADVGDPLPHPNLPIDDANVIESGSITFNSATLATRTFTIDEASKFFGAYAPETGVLGIKVAAEYSPAANADWVVGVEGIAYFAASRSETHNTGEVVPPLTFGS